MVQQINDNPEFKQKMEDAGFVLTDIPCDQMPALLEEMKAEGAEALGIGQ